MQRDKRIPGGICIDEELGCIVIHKHQFFCGDLVQWRTEHHGRGPTLGHADLQEIISKYGQGPHIVYSATRVLRERMPDVGHRQFVQIERDGKLVVDSSGQAVKFSGGWFDPVH